MDYNKVGKVMYEQEQVMQELCTSHSVCCEPKLLKKIKSILKKGEVFKKHFYKEDTNVP